MDKLDSTLIRSLVKDADIPSSELVPLVNLSIPAINKRISRLKSNGVIRSTTVLTDGKSVGKPITAFVLVVLKQFANADDIIEYAASDDDVLECYAVTGEYDYLLKICAADIESFENKLLTMKRCRGIAKSHTMLALMENKLAPSPVPDIPDGSEKQ